MLARSKTKRFLLLAAFTWGGSARGAPGPWPLTPAPLRALPVPRGHFLPRIPRAGRARAELESFLILHSPISIPSPPPPAPREDSPAGNPRPTPSPRAWAQATAGRPAGRGVQRRPPLPGRARGGGDKGEGAPVARPRGPAEAWTCWLLLVRCVPRPLPARLGLSPSAETRGGNEAGCSLRLPPTLFFSWGMRRQSDLLRCPILAHKVPSRAGPVPSRPGYLNPALLPRPAPPRGARGPSAPPPRLPPPGPTASPANCVAFLPQKLPRPPSTFFPSQEA